MGRVLHIVPGLDDPTNGIAVAAKLIAARNGDLIVDAKDFRDLDVARFGFFDEVWVHSMWLPQTMWTCWKVIRAGKKLVRMAHANLDPLRYRYHGWKKRLVAPIERWLFKHTDRVVVTCEAEKKWCQEWGLKNGFQIADLKRFFRLDGGEGLGRRSRSTMEDSLHVLYLGRRHPLKGVEYLERAVEELNQSFERSEHSTCPPKLQRRRNTRTLDLRIVSNAFGEEREKVWDWCDVLVLPTLSDNFGLVVAEALERGKKVITTDGAPVWEEQPGVIYLKGYRDGTNAQRVSLLKNALVELAGT